MKAIIKPFSPRKLSDALFWKVMPNPRVVVTDNMEMMASFEFTPPDASCLSSAQMISARLRLNSVIRSFGDGWAFWFEERKLETSEFEDSRFPDPVSRKINDARRATFTRPGFQHEKRHFLTVLYALQSDASAALSAKFAKADAEDRTADRLFLDECETFEKGIAMLESRLASFMPNVQPLESDDLLTYLHSCISTRPHRVKTPPLPLFLAEFLADEPYVSGYFPMLGEHHIRTIHVKSHPSKSYPDLLATLGDLGFPYRNVVRWLPYSRDAGKKVIEDRKKTWSARTQKVASVLFKRFAPSMADDERGRDLEAPLRVDEANAALELLLSDEVSVGLYTHTVTVSHPDPVLVEKRVKAVQAAMANKGVITSRCEPNAMAAWIGSLPGHARADLGRLLMTSATLCDVLPVTKVWAGPKRDTHLNGPPLLRCISPDGTSFHFSLHPEGQDLGHILFVGEPGAGKSTALASMMAGFRRYAGNRIVMLDKHGSAKVMTLGLGGAFHDLGVPGSVSLQPFADIHLPAEMAFANEWVLARMEEQNEPASSGQREQITAALQALAARDTRFRTISGLRTLVQDEAVKRALSPFCKGGASGDLLDNNTRRVGAENDVICYEMAALFERKSAMPAVLSCIFHEIERCFDGRPTLLLIDEAWAVLKHAMTSDKLEEWLRTARKANVSVVMATQSLSEIANSPLRAVISETVKQRIFGAVGSAMERESSRLMAEFGLSPAQIEIIARLEPKSEYVFMAPGVWRKFGLALSPVELAFAGRSSPQDRAAADRIVQQFSRAEFADRWLAHCGLVEPIQYASAAE